VAKYDKQTLALAASEAITNAHNLLTDAQNLAAQSKYGRALSLLIIGREEAQKAILFSYCAAGVYDISDSEVGKEIKESLERHEYKHASAWYVNLLGTYIISEITKSSPNHEQTLKESVDRLKTVASPKDDRLEHMKWRGLYVRIDQNGNVTHPGDITEQDYRNFLPIAFQHQLYATSLHSILLGGGISSESLQVYRLRAEMFRVLHENSPLDEKKIRRLESRGEIDPLMAGFARFLVQHRLTL